jgi:flavin reductase (DIM6/NTAB) family NADH-FMN oxidoreductase RutF
MIITRPVITAEADAQLASGGGTMAGRSWATGEALRAAMRKTASTVAVVTARGASETRGVTVNTLVMVSLDPPIVSFSVQRHSRMESVLATAEGYVVHILDSDQAPLAHRFAARGRSGAEQFEGIETGLHSAPQLPGALATFMCEPYANVPVGDHIAVFGRVIDVETSDGSSPLLYHDRAYRRVGEAAEPAEREGF